ncbi:CalY family protein [Neobacillus niacini]|uniref:CalY family protein n=1 Tax=Neobacillus niacini TaxID=86668 RepID=UPI00203CB19B|nr:CalY family protein [Neobacillus niacini]MCM3692730.1 CalY family protein [Neobacillus niacini]
MKRVKFIFISVAILLSMVMIFLIQVKDTKADESDYGVDISTTPAEFLFDVKNMKPGDWSTSTLEVNNEGNLDFKLKNLNKKNALILLIEWGHFFMTFLDLSSIP